MQWKPCYLPTVLIEQYLITYIVVILFCEMNTATSSTGLSSQVFDRRKNVMCLVNLGPSVCRHVALYLVTIILLRSLSREWHWGAVIEPRRYRLLHFGGLSATREITPPLYNSGIFTESSVHKLADNETHQTATYCAFGIIFRALFTSKFV